MPDIVGKWMVKIEINTFTSKKNHLLLFAVLCEDGLCFKYFEGGIRTVSSEDVEFKHWWVSRDLFIA